MLFLSYSHIWATPHFHCLGDGVNKATRDSKVAELEFSLGADEDVGRLHICGQEIKFTTI